MSNEFVDVDVRPILRAGNEPFGPIMQALDALEPTQGLRLIAPFKPVPLFDVMGSRGFTHEARELDGGDWEILFRRANAGAGGAATWPAPSRHLDNRDLDPPEPMVRILSAIETMNAGEVLSALLRREPIFLFPELAKRRHQWSGGFDADGSTYRLLVRIETARDTAA